MIVCRFSQQDSLAAPVLPHVILLPDASPGMLPAELDHVGFSRAFELQDQAQSDAEGGRNQVGGLMSITLWFRSRRFVNGLAFWRSTAEWLDGARPAHDAAAFADG